MHLGTRSIRTSGRGSGSVEVTLPAEFRPVVGLPCGIWLQDGPRPNIVLRPDLTVARASFTALWKSLCTAASCADLASCSESWPGDALHLALLPQNGGPALSWADGLALAAGPGTRGTVARAVAAGMTALAGLLGIDDALRPLAGAAAGTLIGAQDANECWQEGADLAASSLGPDWTPGAAWAAHPDWRIDAFWDAAARGLTSVVTQFEDWSRPESGIGALRSAWRRGAGCEIMRG